MRRIDFLGVSGVGKSNLIAKIKMQYITSPEVAVELAALRALSMSESLGWKQSFGILFPKLRGFFLRRVIRTAEAAAFARFAEDHGAFLATAHKSFSLSSRSQHRRAEGYYHFIRTVRRIALLEQWLENEVVLFDESLSHKVYAVMPSDSDNEDYAHRYFGQMPLPTALIHLDGEAGQVVRQVRERERLTGRLVASHRGLSDKELMTYTEASLGVARIGTECLLARGCHVLSLSIADLPEKNAQRVEEFIEKVIR